MAYPCCPLRPAVFLDRDDTLIVNRALPAAAFAKGVRGDLADPAWVRLMPGADQACAALWRAGFVLVVITNQGAVARGGASLAQVHATNARMCQALPVPSTDAESPAKSTRSREAHTDASGFVTAPESGSMIARVYFCPFHPEGCVESFAHEHPLRKPSPGMILAAADDLGLDLAASWLVGDSDRDVLAGIAAGLSPARVLRIGPDSTFADLAGAGAHILGCV